MATFSTAVTSFSTETDGVVNFDSPATFDLVTDHVLRTF